MKQKLQFSQQVPSYTIMDSLINEHISGCSKSRAENVRLKDTFVLAFVDFCNFVKILQREQHYFSILNK